MKKVILLALLMPVSAFGQIVENFESGNIVNWVQSTEGRWKADTTASLSGRFKKPASVGGSYQMVFSGQAWI